MLTDLSRQKRPAVLPRDPSAEREPRLAGVVPKPAAIFFDLDGTILDSESGKEETWLAACEAHFDGTFAPAELLQGIQARTTWFWEKPERILSGRMDLDAATREVVRRALEDLGLTVVELAYRIADDYRARRRESIAPYPGAIETLGAIRAQGISMALLTNGEARNQRRSVEQHGLASYFACIVIEGEFGIGKPDERVFNHARQALGASFESTWMVGDNLEADIAPAVALGMHAVWVDEEGMGVPATAPVRPHRVVRGIRELNA